MRRRIAFLALMLCACGEPDANVDETGYLTGDRIFYTSGQPLTMEQPVTLVGTPGAVARVGGTLTVTNETSQKTAQTTVSNQDGTFILSIDAEREQRLELRYEKDGSDTLSLELKDTLDLPQPMTCPVCIGVLVSPPDMEGLVQVHLSQLENIDPPIITYNESTGDTVSTATAAQSVRLPGSSGQRICVFKQNAERTKASPNICSPVP